MIYILYYKDSGNDNKHNYYVQCTYYTKILLIYTYFSIIQVIVILRNFHTYSVNNIYIYINMHGINTWKM